MCASADTYIITINNFNNQPKEWRNHCGSQNKNFTTI